MEDSPHISTDPAEKERLRSLVRRIVLGQGNRFIKELLRSKGIRIGSTKPEFEANLFAAIDEGRLREGDVRAWLDEVEGWGDQHVYLYEIPPEVADAPAWRNIEEAQRQLIAKGLGDRLNAADPLDFPDDPRVAAVRYEPGVLRLLWHEASSTWVREAKQDKPLEEIEGWTYQFRAYRALDRRAVMRFEFHFAKRLGALFLSVAAASDDHDTSVAEAEKLAADVLSFAALPALRLPIAKAITALDQARVEVPATEKPPVMPQKTRLRGRTGAYVEFGGAADELGYEEDDGVFAVRSAIRGVGVDWFSGTDGAFEFQPTAENALSRPVKVRLFGDQKRLRIFRRLTAQEVWTILSVVARYSR
jgi:hypothetical protein